MEADQYDFGLVAKALKFVKLTKAALYTNIEPQVWGFLKEYKT